ncbi:MAG TPA: Flp family type IVb pilin [Novosphingobium sp.]|nr:Flp family type IVb pilin [Novosphingobium sp.]
MIKTITRMIADTRAATAVEMGLVVALLVVAVMGAMQAFAGEAINLWDDIAAKSRDANSRP